MGLTYKNIELHRTVNSPNKKLGNKPSTPSGEPPRVPKLCPNCKKVVYHNPADCFNLDKNVNKHLDGFRLEWREGTTRLVPAL